MLKPLHICLTNVLLFIAASLLLRREFCCGFQFRRIEQHPTNAFVDSTTTSSRCKNGVPVRSTTTMYTIKSENLMVNGSGKGKNSMLFFEGMDVAALPEGGELSLRSVEADSPPMSFDKFVTMQEKRAVVTIRYSGDAGLKPYFLTIAKKLKQSHPDIVIERRILPSVIDGNYEATFEVLVEGKVVIGKSRHRKVSRNGNNDVHDIIGRRSVYVSMNELDLAISRARRKHRPTTVYGSTGDNDTATSPIIISTSSNNNSGSHSSKLRNNKGLPTGNISNTNGIKNIDTTTSGRMDWSD